MTAYITPDIINLSETLGVKTELDGIAGKPVTKAEPVSKGNYPNCEKTRIVKKTLESVFSRFQGLFVCSNSIVAVTVGFCDECFQFIFVI